MLRLVKLNSVQDLKWEANGGFEPSFCSTLYRTAGVTLSSLKTYLHCPGWNGPNGIGSVWCILTLSHTYPHHTLLLRWVQWQRPGVHDRFVPPMDFATLKWILTCPQSSQCDFTEVQVTHKNRVVFHRILCASYYILELDYCCSGFSYWGGYSHVLSPHLCLGI